MMSSDKKWEAVFKSRRLFEAEVVMGNLQHEGIACVLINKQDSSYLNFGYVEIHVHADEKEHALRIINTEKQDD